MPFVLSFRKQYGTLVLVLFLAANAAHAQLGFCDGSKGDPIFVENFGNSPGFGPQLPAGTTTYAYTPGIPGDGQYTLANTTGGGNPSWHNIPDHTPDEAPGGTNGKVLVVNADLVAGQFFRRVVSGLCANTEFEFSAWIINIYDANQPSCPGTGIPVDVTFEVWDASDTVLLNSGSTGPIEGAVTPLWQQFALTFTVPAGQNGVILKMKNNGGGGCGNDLAIDDIMFSACGDRATLSSPDTNGDVRRICRTATSSPTTIDIAIDLSRPHSFQWQSSTDQSTWTDIAGATGLSYVSPSVSATTYFRVKVAQDVINLGNPFCSTLSNVFSIVILELPDAPVSAGDVSVCDNEPILPLVVTTSDPDVSVKWYDTVSGGAPLHDGLSFIPSSAGTYYAESYRISTGCLSGIRTPVILTIRTAPVIPGDETEQLLLCEGEDLTLDSGMQRLIFDWQPNGERSPKITVTEAGTYTVRVSNVAGCFDTKSFVVTEIPRPVIDDVIVKDKAVTIVTSTTGTYEYAIDEAYFQQSNTFINTDGGLHYAYVRETNGCGLAKAPFFIFEVPLFFTPNSDGFNDYFEIPGFVYVPQTVVQIFTRMGKFLYQLDAGHPVWDGTYNGRPQPADDYWYRAVLTDGSVRTGHFSLLR